GTPCGCHGGERHPGPGSRRARTAKPGGSWPPRAVPPGPPPRPAPTRPPGGVGECARDRLPPCVAGRPSRSRGRLPAEPSERSARAPADRSGRHGLGRGGEDIHAPRRRVARIHDRPRRQERDALPAVGSVMTRGLPMETRILIVDDDPFICRQLEELYTSQQYAVSTAPNATEALKLLGEHEFSLAVVDLKIPGTDGIGLTREIRDRWPDLDVIMITGYASIK